MWQDTQFRSVRSNKLIDARECLGELITALQSLGEEEPSEKSEQQQADNFKIASIGYSFRTQQRQKKQMAEQQPVAKIISVQRKFVPVRASKLRDISAFMSDIAGILANESKAVGKQLQLGDSKKSKSQESAQLQKYGHIEKPTEKANFKFCEEKLPVQQYLPVNYQTKASRKMSLDEDFSDNTRTPMIEQCTQTFEQLAVSGGVGQNSNTTPFCVPQILGQQEQEYNKPTKKKENVANFRDIKNSGRQLFY